MGRFASLCLALTVLAACQDAGPEDVADQFVGTLIAYAETPAPDLLEGAFALLDAPTQAALGERARIAAESLSSPVEPWELLRFDGFVRGERLGGVEEVAVGDDRARVSVRAARAVAPSAGGPAESVEIHELVLVREADGWRVSLPALAGAVSPP